MNSTARQRTARKHKEQHIETRTTIERQGIAQRDKEYPKLNAKRISMETQGTAHK